MQEEKSAVYTVILGVCLLLCLLMLGNMLMGRADTGTAPAAPEEGDAMEFHITEDDIASVLTEALPFPVEDTAVKISRDGTIAVTAAVTRQALTESNLVPGKLRTALLFLPERCKLYGAWSAAVSNGKLSLACRTIKLEGFTLPEQTAQALSDAFAVQWIPAWNSGTSRRRPYSGRTGKRCCWDNRSQQAKEKSLRKTEGISGM